MVRIARERIADLFALAERESTGGDGGLADRYVRLARKVGTRYNVRLLPEYRDVYCRGCSSYWIEGRTVRTRLRAGHQVRTCLRCGRARRIPVPGRTPLSPPPVARRAGVDREEESLAGPLPEAPEESEESDGSEEA